MEQSERVTRSVDLDASPDEVWRALADDDERSAWFDADTRLDLVPGGDGRVVEHDGSVREVRVDEVRPGERLSYDWWTEGEGASRVEFVVVPLPDERTRLTVTETRCSARAGAATASVRSRLVDLELLFLCRSRV